MAHKIELSLSLSALVHSNLLQSLLKTGTLPLLDIHIQTAERPCSQTEVLRFVWKSLSLEI